MKKSLTRIRTSHVGRLPPPKGWQYMPARLANAEVTDPASIATQVTPAIAETVRKQVEARIDCIGDGSSGLPAVLLITPRISPTSRRAPWLPGNRQRPATRPASATNFPILDADMDKAGTLFLVPGEKSISPQSGSGSSSR
jgi:hypothetical protein